MNGAIWMNMVHSRGPSTEEEELTPLTAKTIPESTPKYVYPNISARKVNMKEITNVPGGEDSHQRCGIGTQKIECRERSRVSELTEQSVERKCYDLDLQIAGESQKGKGNPEHRRGHDAYIHAGRVEISLWPDPFVFLSCRDYDSQLLNPIFSVIHPKAGIPKTPSGRMMLKMVEYLRAIILSSPALKKICSGTVPTEQSRPRTTETFQVNCHKSIFF